MPLIEPLLIKTVLGTTTPQLRSDPGEAFLVKDILVRDPVQNYITIKIEKATVGFFRVKGSLGSHLMFRRGRAQHSHTIRINDGSGVAVDHHAPIRDGNSVDRNLMLASKVAPTGDVYDEVRALLWSGFHHNETLLSYLGKLGIFKGYPIAEGETMTIEGMGGTNSICLILYESYSPADIKPDQENGSKSSEYFFINYGDTGDAINTSGDTIYDNPVTPPEFPDFPFGKVVPANHEIEIHGVLASPFAPGENDGTNYCYTQFLKFIKDREVLFDEDRNGILFLSRHTTADGAQDMKAEGFSLIGNFSEYDNNPPFLFPTPLKFQAGDELGVYVNTVKGGTGQNISLEEQQIGLIMKAKRLGKAGA